LARRGEDRQDVCRERSLAGHRIGIWQGSECVFPPGAMRAYMSSEDSVGADKGKIFKFQVWFVDGYDKVENKHSGKFTGHVQVEGVDIGPNTTFDSIRSELEKAGFEITHYPDVIVAKKGLISIFTVETTNKIERVEAWCG
jgi:hypothetical protein